MQEENPIYNGVAPQSKYGLKNQMHIQSLGLGTDPRIQLVQSKKYKYQYTLLIPLHSSPM